LVLQIKTTIYLLIDDDFEFSFQGIIDQTKANFSLILYTILTRIINFLETRYKYLAHKIAFQGAI